MKDDSGRKKENDFFFYTYLKDQTEGTNNTSTGDFLLVKLSKDGNSFDAFKGDVYCGKVHADSRDAQRLKEALESGLEYYAMITSRYNRNGELHIRLYVHRKKDDIDHVDDVDGYIENLEE